MIFRRFALLTSPVKTALSAENSTVTPGISFNPSFTLCWVPSSRTVVKDAGAGTTTTQVGRSLRHRKGITVVTNALNIAMELSHTDLKIIVIGGGVSGDSFALTGSLGIVAVGGIFYDKAFVGVAGIHPDHGLTTNYPDQGPVHQAMIRQARQRIVVADHSKIGNVGTVLIAPITGVDLIITDESASPKLSEFSAKIMMV